YWRACRRLNVNRVRGLPVRLIVRALMWETDDLPSGGEGICETADCDLPGRFPLTGKELLVLKLVGAISVSLALRPARYSIGMSTPSRILSVLKVRLSHLLARLERGRFLHLFPGVIFRVKFAEAHGRGQNSLPRLIPKPVARQRRVLVAVARLCSRVVLGRL